MQYQYCIVSHSLQSNAMPLLTQSPVELVGLALDEQVHAFMLVEQLLAEGILKSLEGLVGGLSGFRNGLALAPCRVGLDQMLELGVVDVICGGAHVSSERRLRRPILARSTYKVPIAVRCARKAPVHISF